METQKATFGGGCFWGIEAAFRRIEGVVDTCAGYMGGDLENPSYEDVCTDMTGHAEVVQVDFDPEVVSFADLLESFWHMHDPTTLNRQGPDVGTQYRSVIFVHDDKQENEAVASRNAVDQSGRFAAPIVTRIEKASQFWRAEEYHQFENRPSGASCKI